MYIWRREIGCECICVSFVVRAYIIYNENQSSDVRLKWNWVSLICQVTTTKVFSRIERFWATLQFNRFEILICFRISRNITLTPLHLSHSTLFFISFFAFSLSIHLHTPSSTYTLYRLFVLLYLMCTHTYSVYCFYLSPNLFYGPFFPLSHTHTHTSLSRHIYWQNLPLWWTRPLLHQKSNIYSIEKISR